MSYPRDLDDLDDLIMQHSSKPARCRLTAADIEVVKDVCTRIRELGAYVGWKEHQEICMKTAGRATTWYSSRHWSEVVRELVPEYGTVR